MIKHLFWSLLGLAELNPLDSIDRTSVTIAHFLYGVFLVLGVILLVNMMIALLNNTYEKVQVQRTFLFNFLFFYIFCLSPWKIALVAEILEVKGTKRKKKKRKTKILEENRH